MFRYIVTLFASVVFVATAFFAWTPTAKSQAIDCSSYCESAFICACAFKLGGNLRETKCEFEGTQTCAAQGEYGYGFQYCDCQPDPKCFDKKEKDEIWLRFPEAYTNPCTPG
jgi:hypothetical protein